MIQTEIRDERTGETIKLDHHDPRYWNGPYRYEPYPKALYRITQPGQKDPEMAIVKSQQEHERLGSAWKESPVDALAHFNALESEVAKAAAESNFADRNMSAAARAERLQHDRSTDEMTVGVPAPKKRGRPAKQQPVSGV